MTGSAFASHRGAGRCIKVGSAGYIPLGRGESEGGMVAGCTGRNGWRMTGSAFAILIARGTLCRGWLRRITYIILNCAREQGVRGCIPREGRRMTGSAFAI